MVDISVIMPVYNSEKYLYEAINSILRQTFKNFELILVDDGSSDSSGDICDYYKKVDSRVKVIHQSNRGISSARNIGILNSVGRYITFADNDDLYKDRFLEDNFKILEKCNADLVKFSIKYIDIDEQGNKKEIYKYELQDREYTPKSISENYEELKRAGVFTFVWNMIVKREVIIDNNIIFDEKIMFGGEDNKFNYQIFKFINKLVCNSNKYYIHFRRLTHSTVMKYNINKAESSLIVSENEYKYLKFLNIDKSLWCKYASEYITFMILIILDDRNIMKVEDKIKFISSLKNKKQFSIDITLREWIFMFKENIKYSLVMLFTFKDKYKLLNFIAKIYNFKRRI